MRVSVGILLFFLFCCANVLGSEGELIACSSYWSNLMDFASRREEKYKKESIMLGSVADGAVVICSNGAICCTDPESYFFIRYFPIVDLKSEVKVKDRGGDFVKIVTSQEHSPGCKLLGLRLGDFGEFADPECNKFFVINEDGKSALYELSGKKCGIIGRAVELYVRRDD